MIKGSTDVYCIFGHPVSHSKSPQMHNCAFQKLSIDACYVAFDVPPVNLKAAIDAARVLKIKGLNITVPHKEAVMPLLDDISDDALTIGAVNTIKNEDNKLRGFNTDYIGFIRSLEENDVTIKNKHFLVLGAGGAGRAVAYGLLTQGAFVSIYNRTIEKALNLANSFKHISQKINVIDYIKSIDDYDVIINTTSLGLNKDDPMPIDITYITDRNIVCDLIYTKTQFLESASKKGCKIIDGKGMLLWQAVYAFKIWTNLTPSVEDFRKIFSQNQR